MTAAALRKPTEKLIAAEDIFRERSEARAILVGACIYELEEAVDGLQLDAERTGLVDMLGQDAVQKMMAEAFGIVPKIAPTVPKLRAEHGADLAVERAKAVTAASTLTAAEYLRLRAWIDQITAEYLIQQNDPARLKRWLDQHTRAERIAIEKHLRAR